LPSHGIGDEPVGDDHRLSARGASALGARRHARSLPVGGTGRSTCAGRGLRHAQGGRVIAKVRRASSPPTMIGSHCVLPRRSRLGTRPAKAREQRPLARRRGWGESAREKLAEMIDRIRGWGGERPRVRRRRSARGGWSRETLTHARKATACWVPKSDHTYNLRVPSGQTEFAPTSS